MGILSLVRAGKESRWGTWRPYWKPWGLRCPEFAPPLPLPGLGGSREKETFWNALRLAVAFASLVRGARVTVGMGTLCACVRGCWRVSG